MTKNVPRTMESEGNFEVSFPKRSTSLLTSKQDLSNHLFFLFREFLGFFNKGKPDLTGNVASPTLKTTSERSLTASSTSQETSFRHALEILLRRSTTCCDHNSSKNFVLNIFFHLKDTGRGCNWEGDFFGFTRTPHFNTKDIRQWHDQSDRGSRQNPLFQLVIPHLLQRSQLNLLH